MYFILYIFQISCIQLKNTFDGAEDKKNNKDNRQSTNRVKGVTRVEDLEAALSSTQGSHTGEDLRRAGLPMPSFPGQSVPRGIHALGPSSTNLASRQQPPHQHPFGAFYGSPSVSNAFVFSSLFLPLLFLAARCLPKKKLMQRRSGLAPIPTFFRAFIRKAGE